MHGVDLRRPARGMGETQPDGFRCHISHRNNALLHAEEEGDFE